MNPECRQHRRSPRGASLSLFALFFVGLVAAPDLGRAQTLGSLTETQKIWGGTVGAGMGTSLAAQGRRAALGGTQIGYFLWDPVLDFTSGASSSTAITSVPLAVAVGRVAHGRGSDVRVTLWLDGATAPSFAEEQSILVGSVAALAMDGSRIALGIPGEDRVEVWVQNGNGDWVFERQFLGTVPGRGFGFAVDLSGSILAIGVPGSTGATGRVEVWRRFLDNWVMLGSYTAPGNEIENSFGASVSVSGNWLAVGAPLEDTAFPQTFMVDPGAVFLYEQESLLGDFEHRLSLFGGDDGDRFGYSLDLDDPTLVVGAPNAETGLFQFQKTDAGTAYVYWRSGDVWSYAARLVAADGDDFDGLGYSSAIFAGGVLVGAPSAKGGFSNDLEDAGGVYFYRGLNPFFLDGFESGDTSMWSTSVP